jgi:DNA-directed RNA polymerase specialized sigma24 family protein
MRVFVMVLLALGTVTDSDQKREPRMVALRHFEDLSNEETAQVLGIKPSPASTRHVRALKRLREVLQRSPGFFDKNRE